MKQDSDHTQKQRNLDEVLKMLQKNQEEFSKNLKQLIKDQEQNGVVQNSYGGLTLRLGDEMGFINKRVPS